MLLSAHFALEELTLSQEAVRRRLDNEPPLELIPVLEDTAQWMEDVRTLLGGKVITVSSGYRSRAVNAAVGGAPSSAHLTGRAVDFNCFGFGGPLSVCEAIAGSGIHYDQLIHEYGRWVHISFAPAMRRQNLTIDRFGTRVGHLPVR